MNRTIALSEAFDRNPEFLSDQTLASFHCHLLIKQILSFIKDVPEGCTPAIKVLAVPELVVEDIGFSNPSFLAFYGHIGNRKSKALLPVHQAGIVLVAISPPDPQCPKRPIGFRID